MEREIERKGAKERARVREIPVLEGEYIELKTYFEQK